MKFDKKRYICVLLEDGLWHLTNERDRLLTIHLPNIRKLISQASDNQREFLNRKKHSMLKRVLNLNKMINYSVILYD